MAKGKYETNVEPKLELIRNWARSGLIESQIAKNLGVAYSTFKLYKEKYPAFSAALKESKEVADYQVINALFESAKGFEYWEETYEKDGDQEKLVRRTKKAQPPNVAAAIFWLKNRDPKNWRDKQHINHSGGVVSKVVDYSHLTDEELDAELSQYDDD